MNPQQQRDWKQHALDTVFHALAESRELSKYLVYKGARILALRLGGAHRASYDLDANLLEAFSRDFPAREDQVTRLTSLITEAITSYVESQDPVRFALGEVKVEHRPRDSHPLGWNAFDVAIRLHDRANEGVRGLPTITFDIAAPEPLGVTAVAPLTVGDQEVYAYTLERLAGEKMRAFLSTLPRYRAKVAKPGESIRTKDIYDVAKILRTHPIGDLEFWSSAGVEFQMACAARRIDCEGIQTFEETLDVTRTIYEKDPTIPTDLAFEDAWEGIRIIVACWDAAGMAAFEHPLDPPTPHLES
ncbi:MAG: nucleotidyl transferase AbiEii/AbiGii toxin family protein [Proteobacteria bacterium]|nr:nucleotidyl transferase AbiEii/AbiGii toxin family protein [Pseudomonadota bacterium]